MILNLYQFGLKTIKKEPNFVTFIQDLIDSIIDEYVTLELCKKHKYTNT